MIPNLEENIFRLSNTDLEVTDSSQNKEKEKILLFPKTITPKPFNPVSSITQEYSLEFICNKWINKQISNFDYLMYLNQIAGMPYYYIKILFIFGIQNIYVSF